MPFLREITKSVLTIMTLAWRWKVLTNVSKQKLIALDDSCLKILKNRLPRKAKHLDYDFPIFFIDLCEGIYFAAFLANWVLFKLCFLANLRFFKNLGSIPFILIFCLVLGLRVGFLWCFRFWLWLVWFLDLDLVQVWDGQCDGPAFWWLIVWK